MCRSPCSQHLPCGLLAVLLLVPLWFRAPAAVADQLGARPGEVRIDADFPGGNIIVERIEGDDVFLRQDQRDTTTWWFYWYFRVQGAEGRTLTFNFTDRNPIGVRGPAVSRDGGRTWTWLGAEAASGASFSYQIPDGPGEVRFCFTIPYVESDWQVFLARHGEHPRLKLGELARTPRGRTVEKVRFGRIDGKPSHRVLLTARHHACETMASFVLEGLMESVLNEEGQEWLRDSVEFLAVPFMDKDGVEDGDQGKNRAPHDHNRDYVGESIYPSVGALRDLAPRWAEDKLRLAIDLHCPYIRNRRNETVFFVMPADPEQSHNLERFTAILEGLPAAGLPYDSGNNLPFGREWNRPEHYGAGRSMRAWASMLPGIQFASTLEIPYANASGAPVTAESARLFGRDLARALKLYLQQQTVPPEAVLGYINAIPPESAESRQERLRRVKERRSGTMIMVHRGASRFAPENTLEACAAAMDRGADGVEIDIRRTADGVLYLFHDDELDRLTPGSGKVDRLSYHELLALGLRGQGTRGDADGSDTPGGQSQRVESAPPTLAALLVLARQRAMLLHLDIKEPGLEKDISALLDAADVWEHVVHINDYNSHELRKDPRLRLVGYKGWLHEAGTSPESVRAFLDRPQPMIFVGHDPTEAVRLLDRSPPEPVPLSSELRAWWTPERIISLRHGIGRGN